MIIDYLLVRYTFILVLPFYRKLVSFFHQSSCKKTSYLKMQRLVRSLNETIQYIDAVIDTRIERRNNTGLVGVTWREDANLKAIMTDLKSQAQVISHSAVKFALLANTSSPSDPNLSRNVTSICDEIGPQIGTFYNIFLYVICFTSKTHIVYYYYLSLVLYNICFLK